MNTRCIRFAVLVIMFFSTSAVFSQTGTGIIAGLNFSSVYGDGIDMIEAMGFDIKTRTGFAAGAFITLAANDRLSFRPELLFDMKGVKQTGTGNAEIIAKTSYLSIPFLAQIGLSPGNAINPIILAGPYLAYLLSAKQEVENVPGMQSEDIKDELNSLDYGVVFGAAVLINEVFEIGARYCMGLRKITKDENAPDLKLKSIEIRAAIHLK